MTTIDEQLKNVDLYKLGGDDMCYTFIEVIDGQIASGVEHISLLMLRTLLIIHKSNSKELIDETVNLITGNTDETVQH